MDRAKNRANGIAWVVACAALGVGLAACGGEVLPEPPDPGGNAGTSSSGTSQGGSPGSGVSSGSSPGSGAGSSGVSSSGGAGSSSGISGSSGSSSSGVVSPGQPIGFSSSSGAGSSSGFSTGGPCGDLAVPAIAKECPDGTYASAEYVDENGECVLTFPCPTMPVSPPVSPPPVSPPPQCTGALPDICELCADGSSACAHYVVENGECVIQLCPPGSTVNPGGPIQVPPAEVIDAGQTGCSQGAACNSGEGCGTASANGGCSVTCECGSGGTFECTGSCETTASPPPPTPG
jgi:hypothetical protein